MPRLISLCLLITVWLLSAGCGGSTGPERAIVSGTVTFEGQPIPEGEIWFLPMEGTKAPQAGARIENGQYELNNKGGVPVGTFQVKITAEREMKTTTPEKPGEPNTPLTTQYLPAKYNTQSELKVTIPPDSGPIQQNFEL